MSCTEIISVLLRLKKTLCGHGPLHPTLKRLVSSLSSPKKFNLEHILYKKGLGLGLDIGYDNSSLEYLIVL